MEIIPRPVPVRRVYQILALEKIQISWVSEFIALKNFIGPSNYKRKSMK